jgi:hypothetical protein
VPAREPTRGGPLDAPTLADELLRRRISRRYVDDVLQDNQVVSLRELAGRSPGRTTDGCELPTVEAAEICQQRFGRSAPLAQPTAPSAQRKRHLENANSQPGLNRM